MPRRGRHLGVRRARGRTPLVVALSAVVVACSSEKALRAACGAGDADACDVLSARYAYGDGVAKDPKLSAEYGARASELCAKVADAGAPSANCLRRGLPIPVVRLDAPPSTPRGSDIVTVFSVVLAADGSARVDDKSVASDDAIGPLAKEAREKNPELRAVIKADSAVSHGRVIHVLDLLKLAQISKIAFGVQPMDPAPAH